MIFLLCFSITYFLTAAFAVPLIFCLLMTVTDCCEGQLGVKRNTLFEQWLIAVDTWLNSGSYASKRVRYASISYETSGTGDNFSGEDFQNTGTFIVVRSSVFGKSSVQKTHLARDAYNA